MNKNYPFVFEIEEHNCHNNSNLNLNNILSKNTKKEILKSPTNILETEKKINSIKNLIELTNEEEEINASSKVSDSEFLFEDGLMMNIIYL